MPPSSSNDRPVPAALAAPQVPAHAAPERRLTLFDTTAIMVGIVIGSGVYQLSPAIARGVDTTWQLWLIWLGGGVFALAGAVCYAELASAYPDDGGDYVYLTRSWGRTVGFLFGWAQLWVVRPGALGSMAFVFANYARQLCDLGVASLPVYASAAIATLAAVNILGVRVGTWTQNVLTISKVGGLLLVCGAGLFGPAATSVDEAIISASVSDQSLWQRWSLSVLLTLFAYSGWNDMTNVAAEVVQPRRNLVRALLWGSASVTSIYLLLSIATVRALGLHGVQHADAVAARTVETLFGELGARGVSLLVCISALGAMNGVILCGSRLYYALGLEHPQLSWLGSWHPRLGTPVVSIATEAAITLATVLALTTAYGLEADCFEQLVIFTTPVFYLFFMLSAASVILLRHRDAGRFRPFRVPGYPTTPIVVCGVAGWMAYSGLRHAWGHGSWEAVWTAVVLLVGLVFVAYERRRTKLPGRE